MFKKILGTKRANLVIDEGRFAGADTALSGRLFYLEAGVASQEKDPQKSLALMAQAHARAVSSQTRHNERLNKAQLIEDPLEREGHVSRIRSDMLYAIADRMTELGQKSEEKGSVANRAMATVHARAANNAGIAYEIRSIAALSGVDALRLRTGLDGERLAETVRRAGAENLLVEHHSRNEAKEDIRSDEIVVQDHGEKADQDPDKIWAARSVLMSEKDFEASVRGVRDDAVEKMFPEDCEDRETLVRRAALKKFSDRTRDLNIYGNKAKLFHNRILNGFPKDSSHRREIGAMMTAIEIRGRQRMSSKSKDKVM